MANQRTFRVSITATNEDGLSLGAYVDVPEQNVEEWRDRIESRLNAFVAQANSQLNFKTTGIVWRERGNRNHLRM